MASEKNRNIEIHVKAFRDLICSDTFEMSEAKALVKDISKACKDLGISINQLGWCLLEDSEHSFEHLGQAMVLEMLRMRKKSENLPPAERQVEGIFTESKAVELMKALWQEGLDVDLCQKNKTPAYLTLLQFGISNHLHHIVRACIEQGADIHRDPTYTSLLSRAMFWGNYEGTAELIRAGISMHEVMNHHGLTPLHIAVDCRDVEMVKMLMSMGADINILDHAGNSCCHQAAKQGSLLVLKCLVECGADISRSNAEHKKPINVASTPETLQYLHELELIQKEKEQLEQCINLVDLKQSSDNDALTLHPAGSVDNAFGAALDSPSKIAPKSPGFKTKAL